MGHEQTVSDEKMLGLIVLMRATIDHLLRIDVGISRPLRALLARSGREIPTSIRRRWSIVARIRTIKPSIFSSETVCSWPIPVRWTFAGLFTYLDDAGRGRDEPRLIKAELYPL